MPELRKDPVTGRWVIISSERRRRPSDFRLDRQAPVGPDYCPFCPGREDLTPPEVLALRPNGGAPNGPGWQVRVVPNKFPALKVEGNLDREGQGMFDRMNGIGAHEVIIETPEHDPHMGLRTEDLEKVLHAFRDRINDLKRDIRFRYILIFKNHGAAAGATLAHPHSQLIALPIVPSFVREEVDGAKRHYGLKERCVFCDILLQETVEGSRVIAENAECVALAPYAPRFPFETWVLPRRHSSRFEDAPDGEYAGLARMVRDVLGKMNRALESPSYNIIIHTSPLSEDTGDFYHWHVEIMPRLSQVAGFEWGTGFYINPTPPEEAARVLRDVRS